MAALVWALGLWCASGAVAPTDAGARLVVLPSIWLLAALVAAALAAVRLLRIAPADAAPLWVAALSLLPLVPLPLPTAALLWIGPLGQLLAAAAAAMTLALRFRGRLTSARPQSALAGVAAVAVMYGAAAWWIAPRIPGGDEPHYLIIAQSLLNDGDLRIEDNHQRREYASYVDGTMRPDYLRRGRNGAIYSIHAPGLSALVLPAFAAGGYPAVVALLTILSASGLIAVWQSARGVGGDGAAIVATAAVGLSAPFFFQSMTVYPDGPAAVVVAAVVWLAMVRGVPSWRAALTVGVLLGVLPWLHTRYAAIAAPLGLIVVGRLLWPSHAPDTARARLGRLVAFVAPAAASALCWFALFLAIYGTWDPRAPYGHATDMRIVRIPHGIAGLLLDQQFGLLPHAPIYLLAFAGFVPLWRRHRRLTLELLLATTPYVLAVAGFHMWWGGRSSPVRFLVPVLLPLAIPLAAWIDGRGRGRTGRAVALGLMAVSLTITAAFVLVDRGALIYNSRDGHALWLLAASSATNLTYALPSLFQGGPADAWITALLWATTAGAGMALLGRYADRDSSARWAQRVLVGIALAVSVGATAGWAVHGVAGRDAGAGMLDAVGRACADHTFAFRTWPMRANDAFNETAGAVIDDASRRPKRPPVVWSAASVPPGRYRVTVRSGLNVTGVLSVALGRPDSVIHTCTLTDQPPGPTSCEIDLPAGAQGLWVSGDPGLVRTAESVVLTLAARDAADCDWRAARAASRDGRVLFVLGGDAWVETGGLWTAGGRDVTLVVPVSGGRARVHVRQGNAGGLVHLRAGQWEDSRRIEGGAVWDAEIPARAGVEAVVLTVSTEASFRPADTDPASSDARTLGAWIEPR